MNFSLGMITRQHAYNCRACIQTQANCAHLSVKKKVLTNCPLMFSRTVLFLSVLFFFPRMWACFGQSRGSVWCSDGRARWNDPQPVSGGLLRGTHGLLWWLFHQQKKEQTNKEMKRRSFFKVPVCLQDCPWNTSHLCVFIWFEVCWPRVSCRMLAVKEWAYCTE